MNWTAWLLIAVTSVILAVGAVCEIQEEAEHEIQEARREFKYY
jgi:hypothetical protein